MDTVPAALRDRMEVIEIPGYTDTDKLNIAKQYLVPRQLEDNGLTDKQVQLQRRGAQAASSRATRARPACATWSATSARSSRAHRRRGRRRQDRQGHRRSTTYVEQDSSARAASSRNSPARTSVPGVATGLAYTPVGGEILFIEATRMPGKGDITLTGQIGDVMKESATAAFSLIRSRAESLGIDPKLAGRERHPHPRARRRRPQGRPQRRRRHVHRAGLAAAQPARSATTWP